MQDPDTLEMFPFNSESHVTNHLNYLFCTDSGQKWTNDLVPRNTYVFFPGGEAEYGQIPESLAERKKLMQKVKARLDEYPYESLSMMRVEWPDPNLWSFGENEYNELFEVVDTLITEGYIPLLIVTHEHQTDMYVHAHWVGWYVGKS